MSNYKTNDLYLSKDKFKELVNLPVVREEYLSLIGQPMPENYGDMADRITLYGISFISGSYEEYHAYHQNLAKAGL